MVSSTSSQVESAIFQRVIGSLGGGIEFGVDIDVDGIDEDGIRMGNGGVGNVNNFTGLENTE